MNTDRVIRRLIVLISFILLILTIILSLVVSDILFYSQTRTDKSADAAVVMGAAAWGSHPSPVYRERLNEAIQLYKQKRVKKLIFTGGTKDMNFPSESKVAMDYAVKQGIKAEDIFTDATSHSTIENLIEAKKIMNRNGINSILLVTDPLHMKRSMFIATQMQMNAHPSPCESSRFQSIPNQLKLLIHETWAFSELLFIHYLVKPMW
jgi:uncharacterized SAM-binding protein YcdF (DUF218 family)